jgi:hypothetical protein
MSEFKLAAFVLFLSNPASFDFVRVFRTAVIVDEFPDRPAEQRHWLQSVYRFQRT